MDLHWDKSSYNMEVKKIKLLLINREKLNKVKCSLRVFKQEHVTYI